MGVVVVVTGTAWGAAMDTPPPARSGGQCVEIGKFLSDIIPWLDEGGLRQMCLGDGSDTLPSDLRSRFREATGKLKKE